MHARLAKTARGITSVLLDDFINNINNAVGVSFIGDHAIALFDQTQRIVAVHFGAGLRFETFNTSLETVYLFTQTIFLATV